MELGTQVLFGAFSDFNSSASTAGQTLEGTYSIKSIKDGKDGKDPYGFITNGDWFFSFKLFFTSKDSKGEKVFKRFITNETLAESKEKNTKIDLVGRTFRVSAAKQKMRGNTPVYTPQSYKGSEKHEDGDGGYDFDGLSNEEWTAIYESEVLVNPVPLYSYTIELKQ